MAKSGNLRIDFVFVQAERSQGFSASKIGTFGFAVGEIIDGFMDGKNDAYKRIAEIISKPELLYVLYYYVISTTPIQICFLGWMLPAGTGIAIISERNSLPMTCWLTSKGKNNKADAGQATTHRCGNQEPRDNAFRRALN